MCAHGSAFSRGGNLQNIQLISSSVPAGGSSTGRVKLIGAVKTDTSVGLVALTPGGGPFAAPSTLIASIPSQVIIPRGYTQATFQILTKSISSQATQRTAAIIAIAVTVRLRDSHLDLIIDCAYSWDPPELHDIRRCERRGIRIAELWARWGYGPVLVLVFHGIASQRQLM